jgi:hypothetical protein
MFDRVRPLLGRPAHSTSGYVTDSVLRSERVSRVPAILSETVADLVAAADKVRADERLVLSADQVLNELEAVFDVVTTLQAEVVHRLRDAEHGDATMQACGRGLKGWLREEMLLAGAESSRYLRLVHALRCYPVTEAAFDAAQISLAHVAAIITALETLPQHLRPTLEPHLVERARFFPPEEIAGFIDELLQGLGFDRRAEIRRERRHAGRGVDLHRTLHGSRSLTGTLTPDVGEQLAKALELAGDCSGTEDDRTPRQRQHDALGTIATAYLASEGTPSFTGAPRSVIITIDLDTLENRLRDTWITLPDGIQIQPATARRLACDAELIPVVLGRGGDIVDIGDAGREFTVTTRRAAYTRQHGTCAFPDCRGPVTELHHIVFRRHGGPGTLDNAAWLCTYHHWLIHEGHWTLHRQPHNGSYRWTGPNGQHRIRHLSTAQE